MFLGVFCGVTLYMITLSRMFIKINVHILSFIKQIIDIFIRIFKVPIKIIMNILRKIIFKPILFVFVNLKRILKEYIKRPLNMLNKVKK